LDRSCKDAHEFVQKHFQKQGVICKMKERVTGIKGNKVITDQGEIETDIAFSCIGFFPVKEPIENGMPDLVDKGFIKVNSKLQVEGFTHVFAAGDITNINEEKLAQNADYHAHIVVENLKRVFLSIF
jgi:apoptosis-inducing factor 2